MSDSEKLKFVILLGFFGFFWAPVFFFVAAALFFGFLLVLHFVVALSLVVEWVLLELEVLLLLFAEEPSADVDSLLVEW